MGKLKTSTLRGVMKPGAHGDGDGLYLQVRVVLRDDARIEQRSWLYRFKLHRKPHLMGLGPYPDVGLSQARDAATAARRLVRQGIDPIAQRREQRAEAAAPPPAAHAFKDVALAYIAKSEADWKNEKHKAQWRSTLETYAFPLLGSTDVAAVDIEGVRAVLDPIWREKPETASRLRGRLETVLDYAEAETWRTGENPARLTKRLALLLGEHGERAKIQHHPALPWAEIGAFMKSLSGQEGIAAMALRFVILTVTRTSEALNATWGEFDLSGPDGPVWTIPAARMKAGREHRVPLSEAAVNILTDATKLRSRDTPDDPVFPGRNPERPMSNMALLMLLRRMERGDLTSHGFRSTFRDWVAEDTKHSHPREIAEAALSHVLKDKTEAAYQRGDLLERRRKLMGDWAAFCSVAHAAQAEAR
jgi:integrase